MMENTTVISCDSSNFGQSQFMVTCSFAIKQKPPVSIYCLCTSHGYSKNLCQLMFSPLNLSLFDTDSFLESLLSVFWTVRFHDDFLIIWKPGCPFFFDIVWRESEKSSYPEIFTLSYSISLNFRSVRRISRTLLWGCSRCRQVLQWKGISTCPLCEILNHFLSLNIHLSRDVWLKIDTRFPEIFIRKRYLEMLYIRLKIRYWTCYQLSYAQDQRDQTNQFSSIWHNHND